MEISFLYIRYEFESASEKTVDLNIFEAYAILVLYGSAWQTYTKFMQVSLQAGRFLEFPFENNAAIRCADFKFQGVIEPFLRQYSFCLESDGAGGHPNGIR